MKKPILAIIIPCFNEELCISVTAQRLIRLIADLKEKVSKNSYLYFVDDGSKDNTWAIIEKLHKSDKRIKGMRFIKNFGNQKAITAGLEAVRELGCDCAVSIDADLQQDERAIEQFIDEFEKGADIVAGIRNSRSTDSFLKKWSAVFFYKTMNVLGAR
ncbi:MAG: glycosyltransferase family 2 protein, partial [Heliobacteriaceae bacterium]|nr:glycosyltransferase family 2 protein [Heliobacteriaceae bacterium]